MSIFTGETFPRAHFGSPGGDYVSLEKCYGEGSSIADKDTNVIPTLIRILAGSFRAKSHVIFRRDSLNQFRAQLGRLRQSGESAVLATPDQDFWIKFLLDTRGHLTLVGRLETEERETLYFFIDDLDQSYIPGFETDLFYLCGV